MAVFSVRKACGGTEEGYALTHGGILGSLRGFRGGVGCRRWPVHATFLPGWLVDGVGLVGKVGRGF